MNKIAKSNSTSALILAIDTSCDETSASVVQGTTILSNVIASQVELHKPYGGVFPTIAKQAHQENIDRTVKLALKKAQINAKNLTAIGVTVGPGLAPALEVGINYAKNLAQQYQKPLLAINHLEAHALSVLAQAQKKSVQTQPAKNLPTLAQRLPALAVIVSGGHSEFVYLDQIGHYQILGQTIDDAVGECLDKVGRMLELGYPAGPVLEKLAKHGNAQTYQFPLPMTTSQDFNLSFSGLKTAAFNKLEALQTEQLLNKQQTLDFAASFQQAVFRHLLHKLEKLLHALIAGKIKNTQQQILTPPKEIWLGGGVAANMTLRSSLRNITRKFNLPLKTPYTKKLCGDNAAMIGVTAFLNLNQIKIEQDWSKIDRQPQLNFPQK